MIVETLRIALQSLNSNKLRTLLSMLGIIIGVGAVIAIVSIGFGAQNQVKDNLTDLGSNVIEIMPGVSRIKGGNFRQTNEHFTIRMIDSLKEANPALANVIPILKGSAQIIHDDLNVQVTLVGTVEYYKQIYNYDLTFGRFFNQRDLDEERNVLVLGSELADELFPNKLPLGQNVRINYNKQVYLFTVIGVMAEKELGITGDFNGQAYLPVTTLMAKMSNDKKLSGYIAQAKSAEQADEAVNQATYFLTKSLGSETDFRIISQDQILNTMNEIESTMSIMLGGIASISLLVGGIGILNIMLVSVTERTKEIGIRKALGAKKKHIIRQFLFEALCLSGIGGLIGILVGQCAGAIISNLGGWSFIVSPLAVLVAFSFALVIGLFFGIYPAVKASKLEPVKALSYE